MQLFFTCKETSGLGPEGRVVRTGCVALIGGSVSQVLHQLAYVLQVLLSCFSGDAQVLLNCCSTARYRTAQRRQSKVWGGTRPDLLALMTAELSWSGERTVFYSWQPGATRSHSIML
jgi:hypothetical protein